MTTASSNRTEGILDGLRAAGIDFVATVPDFNLVGVIEGVANDPAFMHVPLCREEEGVGICTGAYLGGKRPALIMQNAGLLNSCNGLTTTALQFEIPILLVVWYAGDMGDTAFMRLGEVTEPVLDGLGLRYVVVRDPATLSAHIVQAQRLAHYAKRPVAVLVSREVGGGQASAAR